MPRHTVPRVALRYVSGRPINGSDGYPYLQPGEGRWPGWKRQAVRLGVPSVALAVHQAVVVVPTYTAASAALLAGLGALTGGRGLRRRWRMRRFNRTYIRPTVAAVDGALGLVRVQLHVSPELGGLVARLAKPPSPAERAVREWYGLHAEPAVRWLPDQTMRAWWALQRSIRPATSKLEVFRRPRPEAGPRIQLTAGTPYLTDEQRKYVSSVIKGKIPVGDLIESWDQVGPQVTATWTVRKRPPAKVGLAELEAVFPTLEEWEFFLGLGAGGKPVIVSLRDDSPHIAESAGSGAGKSVLAQQIAVQVLRRGGRVVILDRKGSHRWALGVPGVDYCTRPAQMHEALIREAAEADERNSAALYEAEDWDPGPRTLIICEELNATIGQLATYWAETREKGDPKRSPAISALADLLFMGRAAKKNVLAIAQMLTARAIGGPEARENFGVRCLARYTRNAWQMLVPEAAMPRASRTLGRWQIVIGGVAAECQVAYLTAVQARVFATPVTGSAKTPDSALSSNVAGNGGETGNVADPLSEPVTLREAIDEGILPWRKDAAKMRLHRARKAGRVVPEPVGKRGLQSDLYRRGDLIAWSEQERVS
jgi:hypothetical protein